MNGQAETTPTDGTPKVNNTGPEKKTAKASSKRKPRAKKPKPNGAARAAAAAKASEQAAKEGPPVGTVLKLEAAESALIKTAAKNVEAIQKALGEQRARFVAQQAAYEAFEKEQTERLQAANKQYQNAVMAIAEAKGLSTEGQKWTFTPEEESFVRTA